MRVQLFALFAVCAVGCAAESPLASTDSPDVAELESDATVSIGDANTYTITQPAKGSVIPTAVGESIEIDTWIGTPTNLMGWVRLDTTSPSTWRLQVCGIRAGMVAEIDPGSGVLQQYTNLPDDPGCKYVNDLRSVRKFRLVLELGSGSRRKRRDRSWPVAESTSEHWGSHRRICDHRISQWRA